MTLPLDKRSEVPAGVEPVHVSGDQPHSDNNGWRNFLERWCDLRDEHDGVRYYGAANCNYVLFPDGMLVSNYGYNGVALMNLIRKDGVEPTRKTIVAGYAELKRITEANKR